MLRALVLICHFYIQIVYIISLALQKLHDASTYLDPPFYIFWSCRERCCCATVALCHVTYHKRTRRQFGYHASKSAIDIYSTVLAQLHWKKYLSGFPDIHSGFSQKTSKRIGENLNSQRDQSSNSKTTEFRHRHHQLIPDLIYDIGLGPNIPHNKDIRRMKRVTMQTKQTQNRQKRGMISKIAF
jgi:hypothetical protein